MERAYVRNIDFLYIIIIIIGSSISVSISIIVFETNFYPLLLCFCGTLYVSKHIYYVLSYT